MTVSPRIRARLALPHVPDRRPIWEWAHDHIDLPRALAKSGRFDWRDSRHFMGPLAALQSDLVREVNICAPPRSGKTLIADLLVPWVIANDPASIIWVFDVDRSAKLHCEQRCHPILRSCSQTAAMLPDDRHQERKQEIQFSNGLALHVTGPAISNLSARGYRIVIGDELWNWPAGRLGEAKARMDDFAKLESNKFLAISQGGPDGDDWDGQFHSGELNEWHVPCAHCGHLMPTAWTGKRSDGTRWGVIFEEIKHKDGTYHIDATAATARFACRACGHEHPDSAATRSRWNLHGAYVASGDPVRSRKSFRWNSVIDTPLVALVSKWLKAREKVHQGFWADEVQFRQKSLAEWSSERRVIEAENPIEIAEYKPDANWPDELARLIFVDVQSDDLFYVLVTAWSKKECRRLHWEGVYGAAAVEELRIRFNVPAARTLMDCGHVRKEASNIRRTYLIIAQYGYTGVAGRPAMNFAHTDKRTGQRVFKPWSETWWGDPFEGEANRPGNKRARCVHSAFNVVSLRTKGLMDTGFFKDPPADPNDESEAKYRSGLMAEKLMSRRNQKTGMMENYWHQFNPFNHPLDCRRGVTLGAMMMGIL